MGDRVLGIAQQYLCWLVSGGAYFDEVGKAERLVFAPVTHQQVEVGVDQCGLVSVCYLDGRCTNAIAFVGLLFQGRLLSRVDKFHLHSTLASHCVFAQQVAQLRYQRRQCRVGSGTEVGANQERLFQCIQHGERGVGYGVEPPLRGVEPECRHLAQPDIRHYQVGQQQQCERAALTVARTGAPRRPAIALQTLCIEGEESRDQTHIVKEVADIEYAPGDAVEACTAAELAQ